MKTLLISQEKVKSLVTLKEIVDAVEKTFKGLGEGTVINPTKVNLDLGESGGYPNFAGFMNAMPAYVEWAGCASIKWAGGFLGERRKMNLPYVTSLILLIDPRIGNFTSVMDGAFITNMRTGAQTAVGLQYILPEDKKKIRLGVYGAGMQGRTQVMAISQRFSIEQVTVYDISPEATASYAGDVQPFVDGKIVVAKTTREVIVGGDAGVSWSEVQKPFIEYECIAPCSVVFPMGSYQEASEDLILKSDKIIVDHMGQALHRGALAEVSHKGLITEESVYSTIGELAAGKKKARLGANERYVCVPIGTGCMDIAVASIVQKKAQEEGWDKFYEFV